MTDQRFDENTPNTKRRNRIARFRSLARSLTVIAAASTSLGIATPTIAASYVASAVIGNGTSDAGYHPDRIQNDTGAMINSGDLGPLGSVFASASPIDNGTLHVGATNFDTSYELSASAELTYTFLIAPKAGVLPTGTVPIRISAFAAGLFGDSFKTFLSAKLYITQAGNADGVRADVEGQPWSWDGNQRLWTVDRYVNFQPNVPISVFMYADVGLLKDQRNVGSVYVDPQFAIDPTFALQYELVGLPVSTVAALPEPSTWAMAIIGFGAIGSELRRRRRMLVVLM